MIYNWFRFKRTRDEAPLSLFFLFKTDMQVSVAYNSLLLFSAYNLEIVTIQLYWFCFYWRTPPHLLLHQDIVIAFSTCCEENIRRNTNSDEFAIIFVLPIENSLAYWTQRKHNVTHYWHTTFHIFIVCPQTRWHVIEVHSNETWSNQ